MAVVDELEQWARYDGGGGRAARSPGAACVGDCVPVRDSGGMGCASGHGSGGAGAHQGTVAMGRVRSWANQSHDAELNRNSDRVQTLTPAGTCHA